MPADTGNPLEPTAEALAGRSVPRVLKRAFLATRPKFYPASILPVLVGSAWGYRIAGGFDPSLFILALLATVLVHAAANVLNDVGDEISGSDAANTGRIYPYTGGSRFIQNGVMSQQEMLRLGVTLLAAAVLIGITLVALKGLGVLLFGMTGIAFAILYSFPPIQLAARGVGEASVGAAFGMLPVAGAAWLQSGVVDGAVLLISVPVSLWVAAILLINEVPDIEADAGAKKKTLPVRMGLTGARRLYLALQAGALLAIGAAAVRGWLPLATVILPMILFVGAVRAAPSIGPLPGQPGRLKNGIETTLAIHTLGSVWLAGWIWFTA